MTVRAPHGMATMARSVRLESEIGRRGIKLLATGVAECCGPCPVCGGTDRFSINLKKQVWNCRRCERGGDVIELVRHLDGLSFGEAVRLLTGAAAQKPAPSACHGNGDARKAQEPARDAPYDPRAAFEWIYRDETGAPLFRSVRTPEKQFWQSPADGHGGWVKAAKGCMDGVRLVPFYLPEVLAAIRNSGLILIAEGERKVDLLRHLGYAATCNVSGAIRSKLWIDHAKEFFSAGCYAPKIIVLPDKDEAGRKHADTIGAAFAAVGVTVHILELPRLDDKEDVINWYDRGGTREQLDFLIENEAQPWAPGGSRTQPKEQKPPSRVIGAGTFMRSYEPISYTLGGILPSGFMYGITAKQGSGKTAFMIAAALAVAPGREDILGCAVERGRVAYVTIENPVDFKMKLAVNCYVHNISYDEAETWIAIIDGRDTPEQIFDGLSLDAKANGGFQLVCFDTFQAGFAAASAGAFNDNEAVLNYVSHLRPLTTLPDSPSVLVAFHPTKNAGEGELIPYGGGATFNEIDGNLTLWKEGHVKLHHNRLRGPEFEPRFFRIEQLSCPDIVDKAGRQILLPVMRPITETDAAERKTQEGNVELAMLKAMIENEEGSQREWAFKIRKGQSSVGFLLKKLERGKYVSVSFGKWRVTTKGRNAVK